MLQVQHLTIDHTRDLRTILKDFSVTLNAGDKAVIIGESKFCMQCGASLVQKKSTHRKRITLMICALLTVIVIGLTIALILSIKKVPENQTENPIEETVLPVVNNDPNYMVDMDGNIYHTVQIGSQVWMKENMRTKKDKNGKNLTHHTVGSIDDGYAGYWPPVTNSKYTDGSKYGYRYNHAAAEIICPKGWHLPSKTEFELLLQFCADHYHTRGKALADTTEWYAPYDSNNPNCIGNNIHANNQSGFSALPTCEPVFGGVGTRFWTSSYQNWHGGPKPIRMCLYGAGTDAVWESCIVDLSYVRCIRD